MTSVSVLRSEAMAAAFEVGTKLGKVVDLAVVDDPGAAVFVEDGLVAAGEIDDAEAAHAEARAIGDIDAFIVRAAVHDRSHMWCTRASVMLLSRVALTTPAIPHMTCFLPFHADAVWK